ncbi:MAG: hypothetical protein ACOC7T_05135 [Planctomycetota bacterium]
MSHDPAAYSDQTVRSYLQPHDRYQPAQKEGVLQIRPVVLPEGELLKGNNGHFGWPVAAKTDQSVVCVFHRKPQHWGVEGHSLPSDEHTTRAAVAFSTDGCRTWSEPAPIERFADRPIEDCRLGFGNTIGALPDGSVAVVTPYGVFRTRDCGRTWKHLQGAFGGRQLPGPKTNNGPRLCTHPEWGALAPGHAVARNNPERYSRQTTEEGTPWIPPEIWLRYSRDGGETWAEKKQDLPEFASCVEPAVTNHDGALIVLGRCHGRQSFDPDARLWHYVQLVSRDGKEPFEAKLTTITATDVEGRAWHGPWTQDTVEVSFNPVSGRLEALATNRNGGGPPNEHAVEGMSLNLWSIDPDELLAGSADWRFDGTLVQRRGRMTDGFDGMHPGAAVTDRQAGLQHIFCYAGFGSHRFVDAHRRGIAGIFRITRTLDTPTLSAHLKA